MQALIKKKNRSRICQFCSVHQSLPCPVNPQMYAYIDASRHPKPKGGKQLKAAKPGYAHHENKKVNSAMRKVCPNSLVLSSHHARRLKREIAEKMCQQHRKEQFDERLHIAVQYQPLALFCASREIGLNHSFHRLPRFLNLPPETAPQIPRNSRFVQPQLPRREVLPVRLHMNVDRLPLLSRDAL
jgi:hypothetical protein